MKYFLLFLTISTKIEYLEGNKFKCGNQIFPSIYLNDDYCDCQDGSDEFKTGACSNGFFYCENKGFKSFYLPSAKVNDGICG